VVLEPLGEGGMGVVYSAFDHVLERKVALKVVHPQRRASEQNEERLLREAKAMARLSHPNIATVYDVGSQRGQTFLAMELVEGTTLSAWLGSPRSWREVVRVFLLAGRGLAAAHAAGIVHGDFKPHNVLLGASGHVQVADFGLALLVSGVEGGDASARVALHGTPGYMAPEQLAGGPPTPSADQFSFFASLHQGLYGRPPTPGAQPERPSNVPRRLHKVVLQGLSARVEDRFPTLNDALAALERGLTLRRGRLLAGATAAAALLAVGYAEGRGLFTPACEGVDAPAASLWSEEAQTAVRRAFAVAGEVPAQEAVAGVSAQLTRYVAQWRALSVRVCEARHARGAPSAEVQRRQVQCLNDRLSAAKALVDVFKGADRAMTLGAVEATSALAPLTDCDEGPRLRSWAAMKGGTDPRRSEALAETLAQGEALRLTGRFAQALPLATDVVDGARAISDLPLLARALRLRGDLVEKTQADTKASSVVLEEAIVTAEECGDDATASEAHIDLLWNQGFRGSQYAEGWGHARHAEALLHHLGADPALEVKLLAAEASLAYKQGDLEKARDLAQRAVALGTRTLGFDHPSVLQAANVLGQMLAKLGREEEAFAVHQRTLQARERKFGTNHPMVAMSLNNLSVLERKRGHKEEALKMALRAHDIWLASNGPGHQQTANSHLLLANSYLALDRLDEALAEGQQARDLMAKANGEQSDSWATTEYNVGDLLLHKGLLAAAEPHLRRGHEVYAHLRKNADAAIMQAYLAWVELRLGRAKEAHADAQASLAACQALAPNTQECLAETQAVLGLELAQRGDRAEAQAALEAAVDGRFPESDELLAASQWVLAGMLATGKGEVAARGNALANQARTYFVEHPARDAWLREQAAVRHTDVSELLRR
jgi:serine/threonine protein kinase